MKLNYLAFAGLLAAEALATNDITPDKVEADIREDKLQSDLWNLLKIAKDNGGNRAFGLPGYNASLDFVLERVATRASASTLTPQSSPSLISSSPLTRSP
uniref:Uncharacterized protein n=1 Tax=Bionectria ochroleuca TaxID=29856 RepID=A0A8H7NEI9_BIOOC